MSEHLNKLKESFEFYFHKEMNVLKQKRWVINSFQPAIATGISTKADKELIDLSEVSSSEMNFRRKLIQFLGASSNLVPNHFQQSIKCTYAILFIL